MLRNRFHCLWSHVVGPGIRKEGMHRKLPHWTIKHDPRRASTSEGRSHLATTKQTRDHAWTKTLWLRLPTASFLEEDALHVCTKGLTSDSTCVNATSASPPMVAMLLLWLSALLPVGTPGRVQETQARCERCERLQHLPSFTLGRLRGLVLAQAKVLAEAECSCRRDLRFVVQSCLSDTIPAERPASPICQYSVTIG